MTKSLTVLMVSASLTLSAPALAQDSRIKGRVLDGRQAAVATAVVTATQVDSGWKRQVLSNAQGYFQLAPLRPGNYRIEAVKPGFAPLSRTGVDLGAGMTATLDLQMKEAESSETVTSICGLSLGCDCEMFEPSLSAATHSPATADPPLLP